MITTERQKVSPDQLSMLAAWLLVLNRMRADEARLVAIAALDDFRNYNSIRCAICLPAGHPYSIVTAVKHLREQHRSGGHRFVLADEAFDLVAP